MKRWIGLGVVTLVLAACLHVLIVWLLPHAITFAFVRGVTKQIGYNAVFAPPLPTHESRSVVAPSPDLLYAVCVFDVSAGPVRIAARRPQGYWSLSLYDGNSDNFFRTNDSEIKDDAVELILTRGPVDAATRVKYPSATYVQTPRATGVMLSRILVLDPANMQSERDAQSSVRCGPAAG